ncbi:hypothetical protein [Phnomibacter ginsenosidimutans]|uniref:Uncharacterized protein n=1 Tax=Phnomibacter ginsenosidimutans TaxID=2676868 RepID=A0A6I6GAQ2_9BACT|nr:hypothetical protein [Phnomibacter ginsenosidimutans]QGW29474.1 hypothetical protein GLV81_16395 [Phnomibacter ginsenosidimutans]
METKKMSLATVAGKLSRAEMKNVMAGLEDMAVDDGGGVIAGAGYKCCWEGTNNCSVCAAGWTCTKGAVAVKC